MMERKQNQFKPVKHCNSLNSHSLRFNTDSTISNYISNYISVLYRLVVDSTIIYAYEFPVFFVITSWAVKILIWPSTYWAVRLASSSLRLRFETVVRQSIVQVDYISVSWQLTSAAWQSKSVKCFDPGLTSSSNCQIPIHSHFTGRMDWKFFLHAIKKGSGSRSIMKNLSIFKEESIS